MRPKAKAVTLELKDTMLRVVPSGEGWRVTLRPAKSEVFTLGLCLPDVFSSESEALERAGLLWEYLESLRPVSKRMQPVMTPKQFILSNLEWLSIKVIADRVGWEYHRLYQFIMRSSAKDLKKKRDRDALVAALVPFGYVDYDNPFELKEED